MVVSNDIYYSYALYTNNIICGGLIIFQETTFLRNTEKYNHTSYILFKTAPLCNYTLPPATVKVLEKFQKTIL